MNSLLPHEKQLFEMESTLEGLKKQNQTHSLLSEEEMAEMEQKLALLKKNVYSSLKPAERVAICRHPGRPHALDYIEHVTEEFIELFGDRTFRDDHAVVAGLARIGGKKCMVIGQEKGSDTESRLHRNFGMPHPEGYRKALRLMQLAEKFHLPVVTLLDTPGAYPGLAAEERGQGWAIAKNLWEMARLKTPILVLVIGEGCSGGALGMGVGDWVGMLEHAYYSVISPEGCASILWKDSAQSGVAAAALKMHVEELLQLGIVDEKVEEPLGGAHLAPETAYSNVKRFVIKNLERLEKIPLEELLENRYQKFRKMGKVEEHEAPPLSSAPQ